MKTVKVIMYNVIYYALFFWGFHLGFDWAVSLLMIMTWLNIAFSLLILLPSVQAELVKKGIPAPRWLMGIMDISFAILFIYYGATVTAFFWIIRTLIYQAVWEVVEEAKNNV